MVTGTYFSGRGDYYTPWLEIYYYPELRFPSIELDLRDDGRDERLFRTLSELLPPGSHFMVFYVNHKETLRALELGVPPPATYIGYLLWAAGCTWFKDWYFPEGFREGDVKLQGEKPRDEMGRRMNLREMRSELESFLEGESLDNLLLRRAKERAEAVLDEIRSELG